jgi:hypothetical protein
MRKFPTWHRTTRRKRERLGVAIAELELRMRPTCEGDHRLRDVHAHD